jgi:hypothetical protein
MKSEHPTSYTPVENRDETSGTPSRLTDEKISDESGTEATADRALAPAGLNNPFWN